MWSLTSGGNPMDRESVAEPSLTPEPVLRLDGCCVVLPPDISDPQSRRFNRLDLVWILFLIGLAVIPPRAEIHKQLILVAIGMVQLLEG